jgi:hypothetical protein
VIAATIVPLGIGSFALAALLALAVQAVSVGLTWLADRPLQPEVDG